MKRSHVKASIWILLTVAVFALFRWLFELAIPDIALPFSIGITVIIISGLFSGRAVSLSWLIRSDLPQSRSIVIHALILLAVLILIPLLLNVMMGDTKIHHFLFTIFLIFIGCATVASAVTQVRHRIATQLRDAQIAERQTNSELKLLQAQLSPHFLFNTLNNLYGLSLAESRKVPELLLKLSDLLRYSVYETREQLVPVNKEIEYIRNYIDFEKLRMGDRLQLTIEIAEFNERVRIPPMLLIVFVENAFKHSRNSQDEKINIEIGLSQIGEKLSFFVKNPVGVPDEGSKLGKQNSGLGLENVIKRLDLMYPGGYQLETKSENGNFLVNLTIKLR